MRSLHNLHRFKANTAPYLFAHRYKDYRIKGIAETHQNIEIFILISGEVNCRVEENSYTITDGDIVFIRPNEIHTFNSNSCERIVLGISNSFFAENDCQAYAEMFYKSKNGMNNLIKSETAKKYNLINVIKRMEAYINEDTVPETIVKGCLAEFFHMMKKALDESYPKKDSADNLVDEIRLYINNNITSPLSLKTIANRFFISEQYLCRIFKKSMNITVHQYISAKRIKTFETLVKSGTGIQAACMKAGFNDYSSFYRAYKKHTGDSPRCLL